ncbi:MAG TPA: Asp23/Gls24 family envelope stress response protein [Rubrobacteraceae bacterium]|nr:Asp23/Gls24 family envelope stress response protein [Rubrobacteraceae bacterium]
MSEQKSARSGSGSSSPLQTERGNTIIQDSVVSKIAGMAAQEVDGIRMGSGASQTASNILGSITGGGGQTQGVSVEVGQEEAAVDLTLTAAYGKSIPQLSEAVRRNVVNRVESLVGLRVTEVNITVSNIFFPEMEMEQERQRQQEQQQREQEAQEQQRVQ